VNGDFGAQYTLGLQTGEDNRFLKAIVTLKHWDAYSLEDSDGFARYNFNGEYAIQTTPTPHPPTHPPTPDI
jgi:beta-D-xylosidase 4